MRLAPLLTAAVLSACAAVPNAVATPPQAASTVELRAPDGTVIGTAAVLDIPKGVLITIEARGLTPGWHGLHLHEKADCTAPTFTSAGGHVHGGGTAVHGLLRGDANETGDLPNFHVGADGTGQAEVFSPFVSLTGSGGRTALWDADGSSIVIHAARDDHFTQPIGGAGARVACGALTP